ncbi:MAG: hypothetical protein ACE5I7_03965 [Candidatus Binatia bacterium]
MSRDAVDQRWGARTIVRAFTPGPETYHRTYRPHGLTHQSTWVWSCVADESGQQYAITREFKVEASTLAVVSKIEGGTGRDSPRLYDNLYLGILVHDIEPDTGRVRVSSYPSKGSLPFAVDIEPQRYHHIEAGGEVELHFNALGPAMEYFCPGELEDGLYASEFCAVEGVLQGRLVRGFGGMDIAWGPPGVGWTQSKIYRLLEEYWVVFVNEFDDGGREYGVAVDGTGEFSVGFLVRNGMVRHVGGAEIAMGRSADGFPTGAAITLGTEHYRFTTTARVAQIKGFMQWAHGEVVGADGPTRTRRRFAWIEYFATPHREQRKGRQ